MLMKYKHTMSLLILFIFLSLVFLPTISAEKYYADITIDVDRSGLVTIDGPTNHPDLKVDNSPFYTSNKQDLWLLNLTINDVFSNYYFNLNLPDGSSINRVESSGYYEIKEGLSIQGYGQNKSLSIVVIYRVDESAVKNDLLQDNVFLIILLSIIIVSILLIYYIIQDRKNNNTVFVEKTTDTSEYNFRGLTDRQKEIMNYLINQKRALTQTEIQKELNIPKAAVSRNIHSLELKGLIDIEKVGMSNLIRLKKQ